MEWPIVVLVLVLIAGGISTNQEDIETDTVICVGSCTVTIEQGEQ